jgi:phosphate transport system ATP-binding protein
MLLGKQQMDAMMNAMNNTVSAKNKISASGVQVHYGDTHTIEDVSVEILDKTVTAFIGPSGCGKSTFLRTLNRMNDTIDICRVSGDILLDGEDIYDPRIDPVQLRARVGMVFQNQTHSQNPFMIMLLMVRAFTG